MSDYESQVLSILFRFQYATPMSLPRFLNLFAPCPWCPTIKRKPKGGKMSGPGIDDVPRASLVVAEGILKSLVARGVAQVEGNGQAARYFAVRVVSPVDGVQKDVANA